MVKKERIDILLHQRGLAESRGKAQALIMSGVVLADEKRVEKPSEKYACDVNLRIKGESPESRYVSRGGLKLEKALDAFKIDPAGLVCLDIGSSTGGFTDCLLRHGAKRVVAIDSGTNQLDWRIRQDPRVEVHENTNARYLKSGDFHSPFDLTVIDVSFISVTKILPAVIPLADSRCDFLILIKPQFELRREDIGPGGIVREQELHERAIESVKNATVKLGLNAIGVKPSDLPGAEGNQEFFLHARKSG